MANTSMRNSVMAAVVFGAFAFAQAPELHPVPMAMPGPIATPGEQPNIVDPFVEPAQRLSPPVAPGTVPDRPGGPAVPTGVSTQPARRNVVATPDPPTPMVQLKVRTAAHVASGKPVPVKVIVTNPSQATAYKVQVRVGVPEGATLTKCEPPADNAAELKAPGKNAEMVWRFKSLPKGETRTLELEFTPSPDTKELRTPAHVLFEHGVETATVLDKPKIDIRKTASPALVTVDELATVRVEVTNSGTVPIPEARLVEMLPKEAEFRNDKDSEKGANASQRVWQLGTLQPGETKIVTYQLVGKTAGDLVSQSVADSADKLHSAARSKVVESKTKVVQPAIKLEFTGPAGVEPNKPGQYEATVSNTGTQHLKDVRLTIALPEDCTPVKMTKGTRTKEGAVWMVDLPAGESRSYRLGVEAQASGKKVIRATVRDSKTGVEDAKEVATMFQGKADLTWSPNFEPTMLPAGKQGTVTVKVANQGGETEKALRLRVELPEGVVFVQASPNMFDQAKNEIIFKPMQLKPKQTETFTVTYEAKTNGRAYFRVRMEADSLGDRPLLKEHAVEITNAK